MRQFKERLGALGEDEFPQRWTPLPSRLPRRELCISWPSRTFLWPLPRSQGPSLPRTPKSLQGPSAADRGPPALRPAHPCLRLAILARTARLACSRALAGAAGSRHSPLSRAYSPGLSLTHRSGARPQTDKAGAEPVAAAAMLRVAGPQLPGAPARPEALWEAPRRSCGRNAKFSPSVSWFWLEGSAVPWRDGG